jgi:thioredoxin 1
MVIEIESRNFKQEVLDSELPVIAYFMSIRCNTCFALGLVIGELADEYDGRVKFIKLDISRYPEQAENYDIKSLPALLLFDKSTPVKKLLGFWYKSALRGWLDEALQEPNVR